MDQTQPHKREDRRVTKTKTAIREAFSELLNEEGLDAITVTALAQRADIDRKTFYTHYRTIDEVLDDVARRRLSTVLEGVDVATFFDDLEANTFTILENINALLEDEKLIARPPVAEAFDKVLRLYSRIIGEAIVACVDGDVSPRVKEEFELTVHYYVGGVLALYSRWLDSDRTLTLHDLARVAENNIVHGARGLKRPQGN